MPFPSGSSFVRFGRSFASAGRAALRNAASPFPSRAKPTPFPSVPGPKANSGSRGSIQISYFSSGGFSDFIVNPETSPVEGLNQTAG